MQYISHLLLLVLIELGLTWNKCDFDASAEEPVKWSRKDKFQELVDESIKAEEIKLAQLHQVKKLFYQPYLQNKTADWPELSFILLNDKLEHPIDAFVFLNRFFKATKALHSVLGQEKFEKLGEELNFPSYSDLVNCGEALLRLQIFYGINIEDMANGRIEQFSSQHAIMDSGDCFELGKIAYDLEEYTLATKWFQIAFELNNVDKHIEVNELLEYMAFSAYKNNQIKQAADLTKIWISRDPENEKALGNLEYYENELDEDKNTNTDDPFDDTRNSSVRNSSIQIAQSKSYFERYKLGKDFSTVDYNVVEDDVLRYLCTRGNEFVEQNNCIRKISLPGQYISPELRIEIIYEEPNIVRVYDIITKDEASYLQHKAESRLNRATIQTEHGLMTSDFRIAQTAWISNQSDQVVNRIERRIEEVLKIDLSDSEELQIVNYQIGGFYGPHLDASRETAPTSDDIKRTTEISSEARPLKQNDRLATILIYLNHVKAGGSTVFPKLNLTVKPIERSAVIWYNIKKNGYADDRTLHTGCPVLIGTKWIATLWPRERGNTFLRPCGLSSQDSSHTSTFIRKTN